MQKLSILKRLLINLFFTSFLVSPVVQAETTLVLGVYKYQAEQRVIEQYSGLARYLTNRIPGYEIQLKVMDADRLRQAVKSKQVDLLLVNPNLYEIIRNEVMLNGIAGTIQTLHNGQTFESLGGVIFSRSNLPIGKNLKALENKTVAIPTKNNTGAYRVPLYEAFKAGVDINKIQFIEVGNNDSVVESVLSGQAEVGFVRTGILEKWSLNQGLDLNSINIINQKLEHSFPHIVSTRLYPEWPFIILPGLNEDLNRDITTALFSLRATQPAAIQAGIAGFVTPRDYLPLELLLRELKLPPYDAPEKITIQQLWQQYSLHIGVIVLLFLMTWGFVAISQIQKRKIASQEAKLAIKNSIDSALLELPGLAESMTEPELMQYAMEKVELLTESSISFIHFLSEDKNTIELVAWSHNTLQNYCHVPDYQTHYKIEDAGVWAEAAREKRPILINDYETYPNKKGMPEGHAFLKRMISLPVMDNEQVVMLAGIGNRKTPYTQTDINIAQLICNEVWRLIKERRNLNLIHEQKDQFERLLNDLGDDYVVFSHTGEEGILTYISKGFEEVFEQPISHVIHQAWSSNIDWLESSISQANQSITELINRDATHNSFVLKFITPKGKRKSVLIQQTGVYDTNNKLLSVDGLVTNITKQLRNEQTLKQAAQVFEFANEGIMICDADNRILQVNHRFEQITGYPENEVLDRNPNLLSSGHQDNAFYQDMWQKLLSEGRWEGELWNRRKNGEVYPERLKISSIQDTDNKPEYFIALMSDITFEKQQQQQLEKMAHYDALTELPNRFLLSDRISQAISASSRTDNKFAIMFIDLDGFKEVNDTYGHQAGDELLKTIAKRYKDSIRESDTVSRIGGDEFVVLVNSTEDINDFSIIEQRLLEDSSKEVFYKNHALQVSASIGVVYYNANYQKQVGSEQLLRFADQAMYEAKSKGKNAIKHYEWDNLEGFKELQNAFDNEEFELYFQPKVNCVTGEVLSFEGLIRWIHPENGLIPPYQFLPAITQFELNHRLNDYVLDKGMQFLTELNQQGYHIGISLNIDGLNLLSDKFHKKLTTILQKHSTISADQITLEILETSSLEKLKPVAQQIKQLQNEGFKFAIDDFGTGHASLDYLKNLPVDELKIDQEFIREVFSEPNSLSIIEAIKSMAEAFNLSVVAEGAETDEHVELLLQLGIQNIQGYALAKPMDQATTKQWLAKWLPKPEWQDLQEISNDYRNILKAQLSHRAWVSEVEDIIRNNHSSLAIDHLSHMQCEFGIWLNKQGKTLITDTTLYQEICDIHEQIHHDATRAIKASESNDREQALTLIEALHKEKDILLNLLKKSYS